MHKTSVYLTAEDADALREVSDATGMSQSELIREGIRHVVARQSRRARVFHSLGRGAGPGRDDRHWSADELAGKVRGRR